MKFAMRRLIVGSLLLAAAHQIAVTRYGGWEVERGAQLIWSESRAYFFALRSHDGRKGSAIRYVGQALHGWPFRGVPADDQLLWVEVTEITKGAVEKFVLRESGGMPFGVLDGDIYAYYDGRFSRWRNGSFVAVSDEERASFDLRGRTDSFANIDGWSRAYLWGSRGEFTHDLVLDGERLAVKVIRSATRNSIIVSRSNGSSHVIFDSDAGRVSLDAESYQAFVTDIPSK